MWSSVVSSRVWSVTIFIFILFWSCQLFTDLKSPLEVSLYVCIPLSHIQVCFTAIYNMIYGHKCVDTPDTFVCWYGALFRGFVQTTYLQLSELLLLLHAMIFLCCWLCRDCSGKEGMLRMSHPFFSLFFFFCLVKTGLDRGPDLNLIQHLLDEMERRLRGRPSAISVGPQ